MPVSPECLQWYRSIQPDSDGGVIDLSEPITSTELEVLPEIPQPTACEGVTYFRKVFLKNDSPTLTIYEPRIWISNNPLTPTFGFQIGSAGDTTPPAGTYTATASSTDPGVLIGPDIPPSGSLALWIKHEIPNNSGMIPRNELKIAVQGRTAAAGIVKSPEEPFEVLFAHQVQPLILVSDQPAFNGEIWNYPSFIKDLFLNFLRQFFYTFWDENYRYYHCDDQSNPDTRRGLFIADQFTRNLLEREVRPALITERGPIGRRNLVNDNFLDGFRTKRYADLHRGTITISAFCKEGLEAEMLAWVVYSAIQKHIPAIRIAGLHHVGAISIGKETQVVTDSTPAEPIAVVVPVTVEYHFQESWVVKELGGEVMRRVSLSVTDPQGNILTDTADVCTPRAGDVPPCT